MDLKQIAAIALDEAGYAEDMSLEEHDRRFHPNGYKDGQNCRFRREKAQDDSHDAVLSWVPGHDTDGKPGGVSVAICDITKEDADAIVNAANRWMLGGGGVDGAIHRAAGTALLAECKKYPPDENGYRVQTGDAKITDAGDLKAKYVIHTAGPDIRDPESKDDPENGGKLLRSSYRKSLELAKKFGAKSVAFPSISTGIFGYPLEKAAEYAAEEIEAFLAENPEMSVKMCIYDPFDSEKIAAEYERAFKAVEKKVKVRGEGEQRNDSSSDVEDEVPEVRNLRHLLRTNAISKKDFASGIAALAALGKISKGRVGLIKRQMFVEDEVEKLRGCEVESEDAEPMTDLQKHDAKYHGGHYDGKSECKYRDNMAKGDNADKLDPENVDGEEVDEKVKVKGEGEQRKDSDSSNLAKDLNDAKDAVDKALQGGGDLKDVGDSLSDYEKAYNAAAGGAGVKALQGVLGQVQAKSQNGIVAQIIAKRLAAAKAASASANLPKGTLTPQEMRNKAAMDIAKMLGASLTAPAASQNQPSGSGAVPSATQAAQQSTASAAQPTAKPATSNQQPTTTNLGPHAARDISAAGFPQASDFNFSTYGQASAGWQGGSGGSTDPHSIVVNGQKYWVKKAGNNPAYNNLAAMNEVNSNKFLRLAGFNAPESQIYSENGVNYCVTKDTPYNGTASASNSAAEMREAYPLMSLIYSTDAMMNGNTKRDANGMVFLDNGSSFGFSAQGNRPNPNLDWDYDSRTEPDSTKNKQSGIMALLEHPSQHEWKNAYGGKPSQDDVLKEAAKYEMGALVREAYKRGLLNVIPQKGITALQQYADGIDQLSAKYKAAKPAAAAAGASSAGAQSSTGNTQTAPQTAQPAAATASGQQQASQPATAAQPAAQTNPQGFSIPAGPIQFSSSNPLHTQMFNTAHPTWTTPTSGSPSTQLRNAKTIIGALSGFSNMVVNQKTLQINNAIQSILKNGQFTANGRGIGGTVTGANLPRKGIQALQTSMNAVLNPQGLRMQVHNNGNITFSATARSIAKQALAAAGQPTGGAAAASSGQPSAWQNHLAGLQAGPGAKNQQLNNAYQGISNWLKNAGV